MKRPAFQFYPADWQKDPALQSCSIAARGLWVELMCIAHQSDPYGHVCVNGGAASKEQLARLVGEPVKQLSRLLGELAEAGVFSVDKEGRIFSRRMVRDEALRNTRASFGRLGGNPALLAGKDKQNDNQTDNQGSKQSPTPSSSVSSSSSNKGSTDIAWWKTDKGIEATAKTLALKIGPLETYAELKARCFAEIEKRKEAA